MGATCFALSHALGNCWGCKNPSIQSFASIFKLLGWQCSACEGETWTGGLLAIYLPIHLSSDRSSYLWNYHSGRRHNEIVLHVKRHTNRCPPYSASLTGAPIMLRPSLHRRSRFRPQPFGRDCDGVPKQPRFWLESCKPNRGYPGFRALHSTHFIVFSAPFIPFNFALFHAICGPCGPCGPCVVFHSVSFHFLSFLSFHLRSCHFMSGHFNDLIVQPLTHLI